MQEMYTSQRSILIINCSTNFLNIECLASFTVQCKKRGKGARNQTLNNLYTTRIVHKNA